jgi:SOS-response transcriptional repressor LexA
MAVNNVNLLYFRIFTYFCQVFIRKNIINIFCFGALFRMMTWKDRIEHVKTAFSIKNNKQLEELLGLSNGYINDLIGGIKNKNPSKIIVALAEKYKISPVWFFDENVGMFGDNKENTVKRESELILAIRKAEINNEDRFSEIESRLSAIETIIGTEKPVPKAAARDGSLYTAEPTPAYGEEKEERIPYVWDIAAGPPITQSDDSGETVSVPSRLLKKGERYYVASVRGGSMIEAGIRDGDRIIIRCADVPKDGAIQVIRYKDKSTLKRLRQTAKGWELHYEDGSGRVISGDSADYEVQGEFIAVLLPIVANRKEL